MTRKILLIGSIAIGSTVAYATNEPPTNIWNRDTLLGDLGGVRTKISNHGIDFIPVYTGEMMYGIGDIGNNVIYDHNVDLPLDVDLEKLAGWRGATFHANAWWLAGRSLTEDCIGDLANVSNISAYRTFRLQELWLQQNFFDDRVSLKAGSLAVDSDFFCSEASSLFINSSFGAFSLVAANLPNPPIYPVAAPGVRIAAKLNKQLNFQVGVFDGDSGAQDVNRNGVDFHLAAGDGALIFSEISFNPHPDADEKSLAGILKAGAFVHTRRFTTWQDQVNGNGGGSWNYGFYGIAEHDLYKRDARKVTGFIRGGGTPGNRNVIGWYFDIGVNVTGLFPGRAEDILGIAFARSTFSDSYSDYVKATEGFKLSGAEMIVEATYRAQLTPWWTLQPDFQIILAPAGDPKCDTAIVFGLRTAVSF